MNRIPVVTALTLLSLPAFAGSKVVRLTETDPDMELGAALIVANVDVQSGSRESSRNHCIDNVQVSDEDGIVYEPYGARCYADAGGFLWFNGLPSGRYRITKLFFQGDKKYAMDEAGTMTFEVDIEEITFAGSFLVTLETKANGSYKAHSTERLDSATDLEKANLMREVFLRVFHPGNKKSKQALRDLAWVEWYREHPLPEPPAAVPPDAPAEVPPDAPAEVPPDAPAEVPPAEP
ncbi:MAG: hypothetical protein JXB39_11650 [Deltaproteobacteria bacterium]|nr:hypothetical protein [Deltaproteobacteria bacterium]